MRTLVTAIALFFPLCTQALDIETEVHDLRPLFPLSLSITMTGQIENGDADRLRAVLTQYYDPELREISVELDSPGGSLVEGLEIAKVLLARSEIVRAQVGSQQRPNAECASACVIAYLGADLRYISENGKIGVHQFSDPSGTVDAHVGIDIAQRFASEIVNILDHQRVSTELFDQMSNTPPHRITWLSDEDLTLWRVVTGPVFEERMEYRNMNGKVALYMYHESLFGTNEMTLFCGDSLIAYAVLDEPELAMVGGFSLVVDGEDYPVTSAELLNRENARTRVFMEVPEAVSHRLRSARTVGARVHTPGGNMFWGFEQNVRDGRVREMVESCVGSTEEPPRAMSILRSTDLVGNDLNQRGVRGISFQECQRICLGAQSCKAVSYVSAKQWCWPKGAVGERKSAPGIVSAVK